MQLVRFNESASMEELNLQAKMNLTLTQEITENKIFFMYVMIK